MMNRIYILLIITILSTTVAFAQSSACYELTRSKGIAEYKRGAYDRAIMYFDSADACEDKPVNNDLNSWISKCNSAKATATVHETGRRKTNDHREHSSENTLSVSETSIYFDANGGTKQLSVKTNLTIWNTSLVCSWCPVSNSGTTITLHCAANPLTEERTDFFYVTAGDKQVTVNLRQAGKSMTITGSWDTMIKTIMASNPTQNLDNSMYKGQLKDENRNGIGVYLWADNSFYFGGWEQGEKSGSGIYIAPSGYDVYNCPGCKYYVGNFKDNVKSGVGSCYNTNHELIYSGNFANDGPVEKYPKKLKKGIDYRFETSKNTTGAKYVGETKDGKRHGLGIIIRTDGSLWFGEWKNGSRLGEGIDITYTGSITAGRWTGDNYTATIVSASDITVDDKTVKNIQPIINKVSSKIKKLKNSVDDIIH